MPVLKDTRSHVKIAVELRAVPGYSNSFYAVEVIIYGEGFANSVEYIGSLPTREDAEKVYKERLDHYNL